MLEVSIIINNVLALSLLLPFLPPISPLTDRSTTPANDGYWIPKRSLGQRSKNVWIHVHIY